MPMVRKLLISLVLLLIAVVPGTAAAYIPEGFIGISPQSSTNSRDFQLMREAGVRSVRMPLNWSAIQGESPLVVESDWTYFDREVELAAEEGIRLMPFVVGTPDWVAPSQLVLPVNGSWQRWAWANFLRAAVYRYGPSGLFWEEHPALDAYPIRKWEIWNEQNIVSFAKPHDPARYATLLRIAGRVLHGEDPGAKVILGGFFGRPLQIPPNIASGDYLSRVYRARNVKQHFDGVALHPYVAEARAMRAQILNLRRIMRIHGDAGTPLYITELGWGSQSGPTRWERGLWGQANQLSQAFGMISARRREWRIGGVWWFTWSDEGGSCQFCRSAGLLTEKREAKPAWYRFNAWTGGDPDTVPRAQEGHGTGDPEVDAGVGESPAGS
jgi:polysaccharide biosynthesis protein PslG